MKDITCPHCHKAFKVDESGYAEILKQVRNDEFNRAIAERMQTVQKEQAHAQDLVQEQHTRAQQKLAADKDSEIQALKMQLQSTETERKLAVSQALGALEKERDALSVQLQQIQTEQINAKALMQAAHKQTLQQIANEKDQQIQTLQSQITAADTEKQLAVTQAVSIIEKERDQLKMTLQQKEIEKTNELTTLKTQHDMNIKNRDEEIERLKDYKAKLSTKMVGETLEQHCEIEFNRIRAAAFPHAYFEKDNDASAGSKGDYIYRDYDVDGTELTSIMFEMKNEMDTTATKKKNEDFYKKLDEDRTKKGCEYAVLVSLLEPDNELYNAGIVDVSHRYPKMYVVRPQFFILLISLLREAASKSLDSKRELAQVKAQNLDITRFEEKMNDFKKDFGRNYRLASDGFEEAVKRIDEAIKDLEKTKEALHKSANNLRIANDKAEDLSIKKLTRDNPTMSEKFAQQTSNEPAPLC